MTRRLSPDEARMLTLISRAGGSVCPGTDATIPKAAHKMLRSLESRGHLSVAVYDDGPVFTLTAQGMSEVDHG